MKIAIIGLGYVGLPLAKAFSENDLSITGIDIDPIKIKKLNQGKSYIKHINDDQIKELKKNKAKFTTDFSAIKQMNAIIICVPTPLNKYRQPDLSAVLNTGLNIAKYLKKEQLVILESSTYPSTTRIELAKTLETSGLKANRDFFLAYSPEREDPGNINFTTSTIPKVVGADSAKSRQLALNLYKKIIHQVVPVKSTDTAEAVKLTENIFRSVNIALVNELKVIFDEMGIDVWEVIEAASTKPFGFMPFFPGPGLGGHCIPIDPFYLTYKAKEFNLNTKFIELAGEINTSMPKYVIQKIIIALSTKALSVNKSKILIIGITYKPDIDDMRESPSLVIFEELIKLGAKVDFHDPFVKEIPETREHSSLKGIKSKALTMKNLSKYNLVLLATDHSNLNYQLIADNASIIVDTRNALKGYKTKGLLVKS